MNSLPLDSTSALEPGAHLKFDIHTFLAVQLSDCQKSIDIDLISGAFKANAVSERFPRLERHRLN